MAMNLRAITFYTADPTKVHNAKPGGTDWGDVTYKMFDAAGVETAVPSLAVRTQVDLEAPFDYELLGGWADLPEDLKGGTSDAWYLSCVGAPDIPEQYGGSIPFVSEVNLEAVQATRVTVDARRTLPLNYNAQDHRSKVRFTVKHPLGVSKRFQILLEMFR